MIINCPNCDKKFEIDKKLILPDGRLLQCGSCNHKWFFKIENNERNIEIEKKTIADPIIDDNKNLSEKKEEEDLVEEEHDDIEQTSKSKKDYNEKVQKKNDINYFKILIVAFISFAALILVLDTFKVQISVIIPNIQIILDNLYQSINDMKLFIIDLVK